MFGGWVRDSGLQAGEQIRMRREGGRVVIQRVPSDRKASCVALASADVVHAEGRGTAWDLPPECLACIARTILPTALAPEGNRLLRVASTPQYLTAVN
jgi:hypothetical protein